jgi:hypothetical protein
VNFGGNTKGVLGWVFVLVTGVIKLEGGTGSAKNWETNIRPGTDQLLRRPTSGWRLINRSQNIILLL